MIFRGYHAPPRHWGSKYDTLYISNLIRLYLINKKAKHAYESGGQLQLVMTSFFFVCVSRTNGFGMPSSIISYIFNYLWQAACCMLHVAMDMDMYKPDHHYVWSRSRRDTIQIKAEAKAKYCIILLSFMSAAICMHARSMNPLTSILIYMNPSSSTAVSKRSCSDHVHILYVSMIHIPWSRLVKCLVAIIAIGY